MRRQLKGPTLDTIVYIAVDSITRPAYFLIVNGGPTTHHHGADATWRYW